MTTSNPDGSLYSAEGLDADYTYDGNNKRLAIVNADALDALVTERDRAIESVGRLWVAVHRSGRWAEIRDIFDGIGPQDVVLYDGGEVPLVYPEAES